MPQAFSYVETVLLQKPGKPPARDPLDLRPISVAALLARSWAKVRVAQVMQNLAGYWGREIVGYCKGRRPHDLWADLALQVEADQASREPGTMALIADLREEI